MIDVVYDVLIIGAGIGGLSSAALLAKQGYSVKVIESAKRVGGRIASTTYRDHILDNGFHIMPFYKKSAIYSILKQLGIKDRLRLAKVDDIAFYDNEFHRYPKGITDILRMSMIPVKSRIQLLRLLLPLAFSSISKTELWDDTPLTSITSNLDSHTSAFFEAVCMLAFADVAENISLGEFARTIIRANPFKGGTSEFAYPYSGGYDAITNILADYILEEGGEIETDSGVQQVIVQDSTATGVVINSGKSLNARSVIVSYPAYIALHQLFEPNIIDPKFVAKIDKLNKTTSVVEVHFALRSKLDSRQVIFPVGDYTTRGIFFISNITPRVSPHGEHLMIAGTPVSPSVPNNPDKIKSIVNTMKQEISSIYPKFKSDLIWEMPKAWSLVESVVKEPGKVWLSKMPHQIPGINGLFFVGDSTVSYGIGTDSAAHSSILCYPKINDYLSNSS